MPQMAGTMAKAEDSEAALHASSRETIRGGDAPQGDSWTTPSFFRTHLTFHMWTPQTPSVQKWFRFPGLILGSSYNNGKRKCAQFPATVFWIGCMLFGSGEVVIGDSLRQELCGDGATICRVYVLVIALWYCLTSMRPV